MSVTRSGQATPPSQVVPAPQALTRINPKGSRPHWLKTLPAQQLLALLSADETLEKIYQEMRMSRDTWNRDLLPAIHRYAEFVQLAPASESHHHAHVGGLLTHTLETLVAAVKMRRRQLLPFGANAERIDVERDHWSYAVFYAALLHDIGKPLTDLRITWTAASGHTSERKWMPEAGSLIECGAAEYCVRFAPKGERDYGAHSRVGATVLRQIAPQSALTFLGRQPEVFAALTAYLRGEGGDSAIAELIKIADGLSTRRSLSSGSQARFATAVSVPLVELLMGAIKDMLRRGGVLALNRDGGAGWVYDGDVYFVAKRLADEVRKHLAKHSPDEAVPGENKNDRLFDTWQEYGCLKTNPETKQAIWWVLVHGEDGRGYTHRFSMLRFELSKLWDSPDQYPAPMAGRIEILNPKQVGEGEGTTGAEIEAAKPGADVGLPTPGAVLTGTPNPGADLMPKAGPTEEAKPVRSPAWDKPIPGADVPLAPTTGAVPSPVFRQLPRKDAKAAQPPKPAPVVQPPKAGAASSKVEPALGGKSRLPNTGADDADLLPESETAQAEYKKLSAVPKAPKTKHEADHGEMGVSPATPKPATEASAPALTPTPKAPEAVKVAMVEQIAPVSLPMQMPALPDNKKQPSALAIEFMLWLQAGLSSGSIAFNTSSSPVHFVEEGMVLVSPVIFRMFSMDHFTAGEVTREEGLKLVQRAFMAAGWHVRADESDNIHQFTVMPKRGRTTGVTLSAVLLTPAERWISTVPPPNPALKRVVRARQLGDGVAA